MPGTMRTLLDFENAILDLFEKNRITVQDAKIVLWTLLTAIYEDELIEEPQRQENIIENIERQKEQLLVNILLLEIREATVCLLLS
jgi:hypothetical protein